MLIYKIIVNLLNNTKYTIYINILIYIYGRKCRFCILKQI